MSKIMKKTDKINYYKFPDKHGRFGKFGGRFVAETLMPLLLDVEKKYKVKINLIPENQLNLKVNLAIILKITLEDQAHSISQKEFLKRLEM